MYSFEQPTLHEDYIFVSSPRIFIRDYSSSLLYSGQQILQVSAPPTGWKDVGLISNIAIPVTRNIVKLALGLPKTTRKSFELSREAQVTLTFHEIFADTLSNLMGTTQKNVIGAAPITVQTNVTNAVSTFATKEEANRFVVGDKVGFWDISGDAIIPGDKVISAVDPAAKTVTIVGIWTTPPEVGDILISKVGVIASYSAANKTVTLGAAENPRFAAGDRVIWHHVTSDDLLIAKDSVDRVMVNSLDGGGAIVNLKAAFAGSPAAADLLIAYKSIQLLDPLGTIAEKSLLVFFDAVVNEIQRQVAIWYPKVTVTGSFAPDFKNNENFMDANMSFEVQSTTQIVADGSSKTVLQLPFMFD